MKRRALVMSVLLALSGPLAYADTQEPVALTDEQVSLIQSNCITVQSTLQRLHANDALSRVYLGQEYETISTKLMAPMNSRVALNKLDSVALTETTVKFNTELEDFRNLYRDYDQTIARALEIDCRRNPRDFYQTIADARKGRADVRTSVGIMTKLVKQYDERIDALRANTLKPTGGAS